MGGGDPAASAPPLPRPQRLQPPPRRRLQSRLRISDKYVACGACGAGAAGGERGVVQASAAGHRQGTDLSFLPSPRLPNLNLAENVNPARQSRARCSLSARLPVPSTGGRVSTRTEPFCG